jgi:hypothetical protein
MKEIIEFIKWRYKRVERSTIQVWICCMVAFITTVLLTFFTSTNLIVAVTAGAGSLFVTFFAILGYEAITESFKKFRQIKEQEAEEIVRKLKRGY